MSDWEEYELPSLETERRRRWFATGFGLLVFAFAFLVASTALVSCLFSGTEAVENRAAEMFGGPRRVLAYTADAQVSIVLADDPVEGTLHVVVEATEPGGSMLEDAEIELGVTLESSCDVPAWLFVTPTSESTALAEIENCTDTSPEPLGGATVSAAPWDCDMAVGRCETTVEYFVRPQPQVDDDDVDATADVSFQVLIYTSEDLPDDALKTSFSFPDAPGE